MERKYLSHEELEQKCPSIFTKEAASYLSEGYIHIPTIQVIKDMESLGWKPVWAQEVKARERIGFQKHVIKFQHDDYSINYVVENILDSSEEIKPEIILTNSHDGKNSFNLRVGLYRFICSNGLVVADEEYSNVSIRHMGYNLDELNETLKQLLDKIPNLVCTINKLRETEITEKQAEEFVEKAINLRWGEKKRIQVNIKEVLKSERRQDDENNLWCVFNRIQEKFTKGGITTFVEGKSKVRRARGIKQFNQDLKFNAGLWKLAESYINQ